jgi:hypothetical protein
VSVVPIDVDQGQVILLVRAGEWMGVQSEMPEEVRIG